jgi:hypothetical protein
MKYRCYTPKWKPYKYYGARGIMVCEEWKNSYLTFKEWAMANGYQDGLELDRINVNGNYEPSNCKWITHHEQTLNRRDTLYLRFVDTNETFRLYDFCISNAINYDTVNGWRNKDCVNEKLTKILGRNVEIIGGKKGVVSV